MKKAIAALVAAFLFSAISVPARADMVQQLFGINPQSTWLNMESRDVRIDDGVAWWALFGSNPADPGHYASCVTETVTGLAVAVAPAAPFTDCAVFELQAESALPLGGFPSGVGTFLPADATEVEIEGLVPSGTSTATIGPLAVGASSGQSVVNLIECEVTTFDTTSEPINIIGTGGLATPTLGNRDRVVRLSCQDKASASATTPMAPSVDAGFVAISTVTVPFGTTTVSGSMIAPATGQQFTGFALNNAAGFPAFNATSPITYSAGVVACSTCAVKNANNSFSVSQTMPGLTSTAGVAVGGALTGATTGSFSGLVSVGELTSSSSLLTNNGSGGGLLGFGGGAAQIDFAETAAGTMTSTAPFTADGEIKASLAPISASSNGSAQGFVPPVYTAAGAATASTLHVVTGSTACPGTANTLSGAAAFTNTSSYVVIATNANNNSATVEAVNASGTSFQIECSASTQVSWLAIGT